MIVGTAGHIDHGKTTLVHALTGVDTDRLPEEKARGISIELGYAFLPVPGHHGRIGFIDVPGHERLVHTMLAGATGIDYALLLVAADDGVMPQTREHLAVLALLGVPRAAVVVTKADRVDAARLAQVQAEAQALVAGTALAGAPVLAVSATRGDGLAALRELLFEAARTAPPRAAEGAAFRLAIDRAFTLAGVGTVVTGTVHAGRVQVGDELAVVPSAAGLRARVRSLHAQNQVVEQAWAGQRCALALHGVAREQLARGQWVVDPGVALASDRLDVWLTLWQAETRPLRSGTPVHVHIGAADVMGTVAVLRVFGAAGGVASDVPAGDAPVGDMPAADVSADGGAGGDAVPPGAQAWVQLVLREPVAAWRGDRVVLRDTSASRTLAGGRVLDPFAPARYRRAPQRLAELAAMAVPEAAARLQARVAAAPQGVDLRAWWCAEGQQAPALPPLSEGLHAADAHAEWQLAPAHAERLHGVVRSALQTFHAKEPDMLGPDAARLRRLAAPRLPDALWRALLAQLQGQGEVALQGHFVHLPEHGLKLSATDQRLAQKLAPLLAAAGFEGCWARDLARDTGEGEALLRTTLSRLAQRGELHQVVKDLFYPPATMERLAALARQSATAEGGEVTAARFRDATGLGRKRAIQVLEYFDRIGLLRRVGDTHRLRSDTALFMQAASP